MAGTLDLSNPNQPTQNADSTVLVRSMVGRVIPGTCVLSRDHRTVLELETEPNPRPVSRSI
jgi:hypothetical protein